MPVATDVLAERIDHLVTALTETNKETARLNASVEVLRVRIDSSLLVAKWAIGLLTAVVIASAPAVFGIYRDTALTKAAVERIESKIDRLGLSGQGATEQAPRR